MKNIIKLILLSFALFPSISFGATSASHTIAAAWGQIVAGGTNYIGTNLYTRGITVSSIILSNPTGSAQNNIALFDAPDKNIKYLYSVTNALRFSTNISVAFTTPAGISMTNTISGWFTTPNLATTLNVDRNKWLFSTILTNGTATYTFDPPLHLGSGLTVTNSQPVDIVITYDPNF